jgi:hypothetical protein
LGWYCRGLRPRLPAVAAPNDTQKADEDKVYVTGSRA